MIPILYCGNKGVYLQILSSLLSILMRDEKKDVFSVSLFTADLTRIKPSYVPLGTKEEKILNDMVKDFNSESEVHVKDITSLYEKELDHCPNENAYCSPYTLLRLFADETEKVDKLLYLDSDIFFNRDIHLLTDIPLEGYEYAASPDHYGKFFLSPRYINAGVLLFNMEEDRKTHLFEKARAKIKEKKLPFADQDALMRSTTKKKVLPQRYNDQKFLHKNTVVRHFSKRLFYLPYPHTANIKQDQEEKIHSIFHYHQFDDIYERFHIYKEKYEASND